MFSSPVRLPETSRRMVAEGLQRTLADALDLYSQVKVAHWNVKGPHFMPLHELFEKIADTISEHSDAIAERAVTIGALVRGTSRYAAQASRLPELPSDVVKGLDLVALVAERVEAFLDGARAARDLADQQGDGDTADLLTEVVSDLEKHGWFLRATLEGR